MNIENEAYVKDLGHIIYCSGASFDEASTFVSNNSKIISARDLAYARIVEGVDSSLSRVGSYVNEGTLCIPKSSKYKSSKKILLRNSLLSDKTLVRKTSNPSLATLDLKLASKSHFNDEEYVLPLEFNAYKHLENIGNDNYLILKDSGHIPTKRFGEDEITKFLFRDVAQDYGDFLNSNDITTVNLNLHNYDDVHINKYVSPFANQILFHWFGDPNGMCGVYRNTNSHIRVRGLSPKNTRL